MQRPPSLPQNFIYIIHIQYNNLLVHFTRKIYTRYLFRGFHCSQNLFSFLFDILFNFSFQTGFDDRVDQLPRHRILLIFNMRNVAEVQNISDRGNRDEDVLVNE